MLSLQFLLSPIDNSLWPYKSKPSSLILHHRSHRCRNDSRPFLSMFLPKYRALGATADLNYEQEDSNVRLTEAGVPAEEGLLPSGLRRESLPRHVAVVMDGNARWAKRRGLPLSSGHEAGVRALRELMELCRKWGIRVLTVFAFSYENWIRPKVEVDFLMGLFERGIKEDLKNFVREEIQISVIGDSSKLPKSLQKLIAEAEEITRNNTRLHLIVAVSYSGHYDIVQACKNIAHKVQEGLITPDDITADVIEQELETRCTEFPHPDLLIRTSGELRVSNFLLWQLAYTELFFVQSLWPDFGETEFVDVLHSFQQRQRRYGGRD
ncbi:PREDICTED: dehydrodolichyl diphosphate synthase 2 [Nelumbo nucifera]|uniref:Alkyl transferase n=1 Tax=Nelumbo nucifera TaxID=4432 RepID=A0A1U8A8A7_NELNU|nr:PREDICTED: dehydrodolichyl diphosphate synthase 2 [Nelumbo nucifera]